VKSRARNTNTPGAREVSLARAAMLLGKSRNALGAALAEGMPGVSQRGPRGAVEWVLDLAAVVGWLEDRAVRRERERLEAAHTAELERFRLAIAAAEGAGAEPVTRTEALRRRALVQSRLAELDLAEREGRLAPAEDWVAAQSALASAIRGRLLGLPSGAAPQLAQETDVAACESILERLIRNALADLAGEGDAMAHDATVRRAEHANERREAGA
jgi:phage terminase Nu1 subunit (DNA packaging protein)